MSDDARTDDLQSDDAQPDEPTRKIVETTVELPKPEPVKPDLAKHDAASATAKIRAARGSNAPTTRIREEKVDLTAATAEAKAEAEARAAAAERAARTPPVRDDSQSLSLAVTLWLVALVLGVVAAVLAFHPGAPAVSENKAFVDKGETDALMSQAAERVCAPFHYTYEKYDESLKAARAALTGTALKNLNDYAPTSTKVITQAKASQDCHAEFLGVEDLTKDSATVLGSLIISTNVNGMPTDSSTPRIRFTFVNQGGRWLISDYNDV